MSHCHLQSDNETWITSFLKQTGGSRRWTHKIGEARILASALANT